MILRYDFIRVCHFYQFLYKHYFFPCVWYFIISTIVLCDTFVYWCIQVRGPATVWCLCYLYHYALTLTYYSYPISLNCTMRLGAPNNGLSITWPHNENHATRLLTVCNLATRCVVMWLALITSNALVSEIKHTFKQIYLSCFVEYRTTFNICPVLMGPNMVTVVAVTIPVINGARASTEKMMTAKTGMIYLDNETSVLVLA